MFALIDRSIIRISGIDTAKLLQGIITNNVMLLDTQHVIFSALLNPQGKFLYDFFLINDGDDLLLDGETTQSEGLLNLLTMYRLRAKVTFTRLNWYAYASPHHQSSEALTYRDPRHPDMGMRYLSPHPLPITGTRADYERHRLTVGIPEGSYDNIVGRSLLLEMGYDKLHALDFAKGCYVGQEVTARSKFRGTLRKYLHRINSTTPLPSFGTEIISDEGVVIGHMRSSYDTQGLAMIRTEELVTAHSTFAGTQPVTVTPLEWLIA